VAYGSPLHLVNEKQGEIFVSFYELQGREKKLKFEALVNFSVAPFRGTHSYFIFNFYLQHVPTCFSGIKIVEKSLLTEPSWSFGGSQVGPQCYCSQ
jgi:hypothetical protein